MPEFFDYDPLTKTTQYFEYDDATGTSYIHYEQDITKVAEYTQQHARDGATDVYERDLALVREGQFARVSVEAYPGVDFPATLAAIGDLVDPVTRTIKVRAWVNNEAHKLKPEMFARLHLDVGEASQFIVVPREAVLEADGKQFVYVVEDQNRYVKREVKVANISPEQVRVLEGLARGQRIVTKGAMLIKSQEVKGF